MGTPLKIDVGRTPRQRGSPLTQELEAHWTRPQEADGGVGRGPRGSALRGFITIGGPQAHGDSLTVGAQ